MTLNHPKTVSSGYGLILILGILAVVAIMASALVPDLVRQSLHRQIQEESRRLSLLAQGYLQAVHRTQIIPGPKNWIEAVARETGLNIAEVAQVYSTFPSDTNTRRICLVHPAFTPGYGDERLPYSQQASGIGQGDTNAPTKNSRVMILSNIRRDLPLPHTSGLLSSAEFEAIWNWTCNPDTKAPPIGWPAAWQHHGDALHVARLNLKNEFHLIELNNLHYRLHGSSPVNVVSNQIHRHYLQGSLIELFFTNGSPYAQHIINKDVTFSPDEIRTEPWLPSDSLEPRSTRIQH